MSCPGASGVTTRPPATSFWLAGREPARRAPASGGPWRLRACAPRFEPVPRNARQLVGRSGTRSCGTGGVSTRSARPPRCYGPSGDTPPAPRLRWQLWALRPGLDGASRPPTTLTGCGGTPDSGRAGPEPASRAATTTRRCRSTYAVSSGVSFGCRQGVSFECRLTRRSSARSAADLIVGGRQAGARSRNAVPPGRWSGVPTPAR